MIGLSPFDLMYYHLELDDNLLRMMAISISLNFDRKYDNNLKYKNYFNSTLPWKEQFFYKEKSYWKEFNEKNIPDWLSVKNDDRFKKFHFKIKTYCSFVFHHIRTIDKVSIDYLIESLDPVKNLSYLNKLKVSGGRGDNSILSTYNKKFIIKTINKEEKNILNKMLKAYHKRLKDTKSILCRIYGLYKIELEDKGKIHIILQRNMDSLPEETKLLTFDLKGSTVDRQSINKIDEKLKSNLLMKKYKNKVLKDVDLKILKLNFMLDTNEALNLIKSIKNDSEFLERYEVTDYSLLVFVHKYRQNDININLINSGVMKSYDKKYLFEFSIIDFLGTFNFIKKSEKLAKTFVGYIKQMKDTNFSVLDPERYGLRLRNFVEKIIPINLENDTD
jgi:1-phosphatidylinositol-4-phosphate 5-kinase